MFILCTFWLHIDTFVELATIYFIVVLLNLKLLSSAATLSALYLKTEKRSSWSKLCSDWTLSWMPISFLGKNRPSRRGGSIALYVREQLECIEIHLGMNDICGWELRCRLIGGPLDQEEEVDVVFYRQLEVVSQSQALVLIKLWACCWMLWCHGTWKGEVTGCLLCFNLYC